MRLTIDTDENEIRATRTVFKSGNSVLVTLPPEVCQLAGLEADDDVTLSIGFDESVIHIEKEPPDGTDD